MDKKNQEKIYMVLHEGVHNMWVIDMEGKSEPFELPKRQINMVFIKVDPKTVKVLFSERVEQNESPIGEENPYGQEGVDYSTPTDKP